MTTLSCSRCWTVAMFLAIGKFKSNLSRESESELKCHQEFMSAAKVFFEDFLSFSLSNIVNK